MTKISAASLVPAATPGMKIPTGEVGDLAVTMTLIRQSMGFVIPEDYGATGDGIVDDTAFMQLALLSGYEVVIPPNKTYLINTANLTISTGVKLRGCGQTSKLKTTGNLSILSPIGRDITISDLRFVGNNTGAAQRGIDITGVVGLTSDFTNIKLINVDFESIRTGLYVTNAMGTSSLVHEGAIMAINCKAITCTIGFDLDNRAEYCLLSNCHAFSCTTSYRHFGGNNRFTGCQATDYTTGLLLGTGSNDGKSTWCGGALNHGTNAISSTGLTNGFEITDTYIQVGSVSLTTSAGVIFNNVVFGTANITVNTCTLIQFTNITFRTTPTVTITGTDPEWFKIKFELGVVPTAVHDPYNWIISKRYIAGRFYTNSIGANLLVTQAVGANILRAFPWRIQQKITIDLFEINVTTGVAGTCRFAIYEDNGSGYPGAVVANSDAGTYNTTTSATYIQNTPAANVTLNPGLYWIAYNSDAGATLKAHTPADNLIGGAAGVDGEGACWSVALTYGAMPATFTAGGTVVTFQSVTGCPRLKCRAV